jgi:hypothetical protein
MAAKGKTPAKSTRPRRGAPPPVVVSRPKPWGLIAATVAMVVFAGGVIGYAIHQVQVKKGDTPEKRAADAAAIQGITVTNPPSRNHVQTPVDYPQSPPIGGDHDAEWADCTGTVYPSQIRNENAVHAMEHGAVWITYQPTLSAAEVDALKHRVDGVTYMMLSPYPGLKTKVSLQSWGHQIFVNSTDDPLIDRFIKDLKLNSATTPEFGASCEDPAFKSNPRPPDSGAAPPASPTATASASSAPPASPSASNQP